MKTRRFRKAIDQVPTPAPVPVPEPVAAPEKESLSDIMANLRDLMRSIEIVPDEPGKAMVSRRSRLGL